MKLFKILFAIIGGVILLVLLIVIGVIIAFTSSQDNFDASKINPELTKNELLANELNTGLDKMKDEYKLDVTFSEEDLDSLIYAFVKEQLNDKYNPIDGESDEELYIMNANLGFTNALVKHAYANISGDELTLNVTGSAGFIKSRVQLTLKVETTDDEYILHIIKGKVGKVNVFSKFVLNILKKNGLDTELNNFLKEKNIPFVLNIDNKTFTCTKDEFSAWVDTLLSKEGEEKDASSVMASTLIDVLLSTENDFVTFGMIEENEFGVDIDLNVLKVDSSLTTLDPAIKEAIDTSNLIKNKSQTLAINALTGNGTYMTFSEIEISRLIYTTSNGYESFKKDSEIMEGVYFHFAIEGIILDIEEDGLGLSVTIILNINGLLTIAKYSGTTNQVAPTQIDIKMDEVLYLGDNLEIDSEFIGALLEESFKNNTFLSYNSETNTLTLSSSVFDEYLQKASIASPVTVNGIEFKTDVLNVKLQVMNPLTQLSIDKASALIRNALQGEFLDTSLYSQDPETQAVLQELSENLDDLREQLNDPSVDPSDLDTEDVVNTINKLSTDDQETFFGQLQEEAGETDIEQLYNDLFHNGD